MPKISIIMPVYNVAAYVDAAMNSVLQQTECDLELVVVDDGSTEKTAESVAITAANDSRVRLFHQSNSGMPAVAVTTEYQSLAGS